MSLIGGICHFDGGVVDLGPLAMLGRYLSTRGPDGGREVCMGSVGMVYRAFHTNRESRKETQPLVSPNRQMIAWDGRLDNREELLTLLRDEIRDFQTDVAIVMAAYRKWNLDFLGKLVGDFALSLWDPASSTLLLARDPVGTRTLFYCLDNKRCIWSSDLNALVDLADLDLRVNDEYVAGYLAYIPEPSLTPYKDIHAVAPGGFLIVRRGKIQFERFWGLNPNFQIRYKTDEEYEQHFCQVFREAVRRRLRVEGTVWAELSGGLDSSSIVRTADHIIGTGDAQATRLDTVSLVYDNSPKADERKFICHIEQQRSRVGHHLREEDHPILSPLVDESSITSPNPLHCFSEYHRGLSQAMSKAGVRVVLSGQGGDEMLCSGADPSPELADLFVLHKVGELHRRLQIWSQNLKRPYLKLLWQSAILPSCPPKLQAPFGHRVFRKIPPWYAKSFVARMNLSARMNVTSDIFGFRMPSGRAQAMGFLSVVKNVSAGYRQQLGNIEISYPYTDRSLVEFLQAIPFEQMVRTGETRSLMRRALKGVLPEKVLKRKSKGDPTEAFFRAIIREAPRLKQLLNDSPRVSEYGYVDSSIMLAALEKARHGLETNTVALAKTISLELWLRTLEKRRAQAFSADASEGNVSRTPIMKIATVEP